LSRGWGGLRPGAFRHPPSPAAYFNILAEGAEEWFAKRPEDAAGLARRISEFRQGCTVMILARHSPLSSLDRHWLVGSCRLWASSFDRRLAEVERGEDPLLQVRARTDEVVREIAQALRARAPAPA
jgi:hypothetical protein